MAKIEVVKQEVEINLTLNEAELKTIVSALTTSHHKIKEYSREYNFQDDILNSMDEATLYTELKEVAKKL